MSIHSRIKARRIATGYQSHKALADAVGVSWQTVQLWEKEGGTAPNRSRLPKVAKALQCTPNYLLYGTDDMPSADLVIGTDDGKAYIFEAKIPPQVEYIFASSEEIRLLSLYRRCDERGQSEVMDRLKALEKVVPLPSLLGDTSRN